MTVDANLREELRPTGYASATCPKCVLFDRCGGLFNNRPLLNCFEQFCCEDGSCDHVCPYKPADYRRRMLEIGGLRFDDIPPLHQLPIALPTYIPMVHHAYRRSGDLQADVVALDPYSIFRCRNGGYRSVVDCGAALRRHFKIAPAARVILRGTAEDRFLEQFWSYRKSDGVVEQIASLGVSLVIGPNYSQFLDVPRSDCLFNRKRQLLCLAEMSQAGISVAPHLSALMPPDWSFWTEFLRSNDQLHHVALNFQTGNKNVNEGQKVIDRVRKVQDTIGRPLSLILIGGAQFVQYTARHLGRFVLIDSQPFAKSHRRRLFQPDGEKRRWPETWTLATQPIDHILQGNIDEYARWVAMRGAISNPNLN
jgi:Domain of unknown function (DUF4417)